MILPIVTAIIPTTHDRLRYNERILNLFIKQNYEKKNIIFDYNDGAIGEKRNRLCDQAYGEVIIHFDSDDSYKEDWISKSVEALLQSEADIAGLSIVNFYDEQKQEGYQYRWHHNPRSPGWVCGATLCYWKKFWKLHPFRDINVSEDTVFVSTPGAVICAHDYVEGFLASIHPNNTSPRELYVNPRYRRMSESEEKEVRKRFFAAEGSFSI